ncbi:MAG: alpha/beta hydrolase [Planctomycetota bacterium]
MNRIFRWIAILVVPGCAQMEPISPLAPLERSLIFHPTDYPERVPTIPGLTVEEAWIETDNGTIHGLYASNPNPAGVALFCHGNAGTAAHRIESLAVLNQRHRLSVLIFDYQGFGKSSGKPTQSGILDDARSARKWLADRESIAESEVILMGRSLGGAVAVDLASEDGAKGLILASTFTSLPDVASHHFKWLPAHLLMTHRLNSLDKIKHYDGPLLCSHGDKDEVIPFELGEQLFEAAPGRKQFIRIPEGTHNSQMTEEYRQEFETFITSLSSRP